MSFCCGITQRNLFCSRTCSSVRAAARKLLQPNRT